MTDDTTDTTDASLSECTHERFERNHYFHGKLMTARDMAAEQAYHVGQRRAHARSVSGRGVAWGLGTEVEYEGPEEEAVVVTVKRGYAIDACGRPVVVPQEREKTITDSAVVGASAVTVWLEYEACLKESVPVEGAESACEDECAYNRVLEVYDVRVEAGYPPNVTEVDPDELVKPVEPVTFPGKDDLPTADEGQPDPDDPGLSTIAESYRRAAGDATGAGEDGEIYLGTYTPGPNDPWERDESQPTPYVYSNDMLYAAIARHAADFENPHQDSLIARPQESGGGDGSGGGGSGATEADLAPGETYAQGQQLRIDATGTGEAAEELGFEWSADGENTLQLRRVDVEDDWPISGFVSEVEIDVDDQGVIETGDLEGRYVLSFDGDQAIVVDPDGFQDVVDEPEAVEEVAFAVEVPEPSSSTTASAPGARLRVEHDRSTGGAVDLTSPDGTVSIATSTGGDEAHSEIDLSVAEYVGRIVEERLEPLERYAMEKALKYTALVFEQATGRFGDDASSVAEEIAVFARGAADGRLRDGTSAEAAEARDVLNRDWEVEDHLSEEVFGQIVAQLEELEAQYLEAVSGSVTEVSGRRLQVALDRLGSATGPDAGTLSLASAQDDVVDAVEWLEPVDEEEEEEEESVAEFTESIYSVVRGDLAEMTVTLEDTDTATLVVGSEDANYVSHVDLEDGSGDGTVTVLMNTYLAGRSEDRESDAFGTAHDDDDVGASIEVGPIDGPLDSATYDLSLEVDGTRTDVASLSLIDRSTESLTVHRAPPRAYEELTTPGALDDARDGGLVTPADGVSPGETVVVDVEASGVFGAIAAEGGGALTSASPEGFLALVESEGVEFAVTMEETPNRPPKFVDLAASVEEGAARMLPDEDGGRLFLVVHSGDATFRSSPDGDALAPQPGENYRARFRVADLDGLSEDDEPVTAHFEFVEGFGSFDTGESEFVTVANAEDQAITGTTNLAPGTELTLRARSADRDAPFVLTDDATVTEEGTFEGSFDFSDVQPDTAFTVSLPAIGVEADGRVFAGT